MVIEKIDKDLYRIKTGEQLSVYIKVDEYIRITQPQLSDTDEFNEKDCFGKGFPQEIIIEKKEFKEVMTYLNKLLIMENLE